MEEKKLFVNPEMEIILVASEDVIFTSGPVLFDAELIFGEDYEEWY